MKNSNYDKTKLPEEILNALPFLLSCISKEGRYVLMNDHHANYYGIDRNDAIGKQCHNFLTLESEIIAQLDSPLTGEDFFLSEMINQQSSYPKEHCYWLSATVPLKLHQHHDYDHLIMLAIDITGIINNISQLSIKAFTDSLTGLFNRHWLNGYIDRHQIENDSPPEKSRRGIIIIDLDNFKHINDRWGHDTGDAVLKIAARRLLLVIRQQDKLVRFGGDEFVAVINDATPALLQDITSRLSYCLCRSPVQFERKTINISASIGCSEYYPQEDFLSCLKTADEALYMAKQSGRNHAFFGERKR